LLVDEVDALRAAFRAVQAVHSFRIDAAVILLDHLHCIWTLPSWRFRLLHAVGFDQRKFLSLHTERGTTVTKPDKER
jgi:putative transposase